jgi:hypothetical protein
MRDPRRCLKNGPFYDVRGQPSCLQIGFIY